ncbi:uncharacterized protein LOC108044981 [Drosophila rhopaloa]|uniref:Uncharacterized protein LOC108044981 n=1 Tax=Drosophila rhopaloa TaxID=1041015 RepID=A0A6P4EN53_DRORH|nr:uncharacterized protein LOC108044981 [Drosophila rhopaloa]
MFFRRLQGFLILSTLSVCLGKSLEARVQSFNTIEGDEESLFVYNVRLIGRDRMLNGTFVFKVDLDDTFDVSFNILVFKNGEWEEGNIKVFTKACNFHTNYFGKYFLPMVNDSNIPPVNELCPFRKGKYYVKNILIEPKNWPTVLYRGLTKSIVKYIRNGKCTGGVEYDMSLTDIND